MQVISTCFFVPLAFRLGVYEISCKKKAEGAETRDGGHKSRSESRIGRGYCTNQEAESTEKTFEVVEQMPAFPGGDAALMKYLSENIKYPKAAEKAGEQGRVVVNFYCRERWGDI